MSRLENYLNEKASKSPLVYHGSYDSGIKKFSTGYRFSETNVRLLGAYFTDNIEMAKTFGSGLHIYKVKLKFQKLIDMTKWPALKADNKFVESLPELTREEIEHYIKVDYYGNDSAFHVIETLDGKYDLLKRWKSKGYDGIAFHEYHMGEKGVTYIPFRSSQIKLLEVP